ncbi:hypothetical protein NDU88_010057 [Pleurodeles waltl]|uniref:Uncharacterized protein n=1 Tax=Pleurodeles waltl TaxID=8319 RepID=A0AAV7QWA1_PLEWA|nr:hypothetical protein NDU88_010057 [Pleurodeles waltl]
MSKTYDHNIDLLTCPESRIENEALRALAADSNITIKPADKGGAIVVMNTKDYRQECLRLLGDSTYYAHIDRDPTGCLQTEIRSYLATDHLIDGRALCMRTIYAGSLPFPHMFGNATPGATDRKGNPVRFSPVKRLMTS